MRRTVTVVMGGLVLLFAAALPATSMSAQGPQGYRLVGIVMVEGDAPYTAAVFEFEGRQTAEGAPTRQQKLYRVGDNVGGASITQIQSQHVLLQRGKQVELVGITGGCAEDEQSAEAKQATIQLPAGVRDPARALGQVLSKQLPPYDPRVTRKAVSSTMVDRLSHYLQEQFAREQKEHYSTFTKTALGDGLGLIGAEGDLLSNLGLEPMDLIVGVSGMGLDSPERLQQIVEVLGRAKVFNLSVLRGGVVHPLSYEVQSPM